MSSPRRDRCGLWALFTLLPRPPRWALCQVPWLATVPTRYQGHVREPLCGRPPRCPRPDPCGPMHVYMQALLHFPAGPRTVVASSWGRGRQGVDRGMCSDLDSPGAVWEQPPGCAACNTRVVTDGTV